MNKIFYLLDYHAFDYNFTRRYSHHVKVRILEIIQNLKLTHIYNEFTRA